MKEMLFGFFGASLVVTCAIGIIPLIGINYDVKLEITFAHILLSEVILTLTFYFFYKLMKGVDLN